MIGTAGEGVDELEVGPGVRQFGGVELGQQMVDGSVRTRIGHRMYVTVKTPALASGHRSASVRNRSRSRNGRHPPSELLTDDTHQGRLGAVGDQPYGVHQLLAAGS